MFSFIKFKLNSFKKFLGEFLFELTCAIAAALLVAFEIIAWPYLSVLIAIFGKGNSDDPEISTIVNVARIAVASELLWQIIKVLQQ